MKLVGGLLLLVMTGSVVCAAEPVKRTTKAAPRLAEPWWKQRHEATLKLAAKGGWEVAFIGDSITQGWEGHGKRIWEKFYGSRQAINLGFSGDGTEHVLWRLQNGEADGYKPKLAIIMIGTNNTGHPPSDPPADIAAGVQAILGELKTRWPGTKVLLLGIFPRSVNPTDAARINNAEANKLLAGFADGQRVHYLDISEKFLTPAGVLSKEVMPDALHPQQKGYQIWADAMEPTVRQLLKP